MLRCGLTALLVAVSKLTASPQLLQRAHILDTPDNITRWAAHVYNLAARMRSPDLR